MVEVRHCSCKAFLSHWTELLGGGGDRMSSVVKAIYLLVCLLCYWIEQAGGYRWPTQSALEVCHRPCDCVGGVVTA